MNANLKFRVTHDIPPDALHLLEMFMENWLDKNCNTEVEIKRHNEPDTLTTVYEVSLDSPEDEFWIRLSGVPHNLGNYITLH